MFSYFASVCSIKFSSWSEYGVKREGGRDGEMEGMGEMNGEKWVYIYLNSVS